MESYIEVNLDAIEHNTKNILKKYSNYEYYIGVLKANSYGHGMYIVNTLIKNGINYIATFTLGEAIKVRELNKDIPILILHPIDIDEVKIAVKNNITLTVCEYSYLEQLINLNKKMKIHLKIDSGMNRLGFNNKEDFMKAYSLLLNQSKIYLEGIYSHFATIGVIDTNWDKQINKFKEITSLIDLSTIKMVHMGSSLNMIMHPKIPFCNTIRIGSVLYGYNLSYRLERGVKNKFRKLRNLLLQKKNKISKTYRNVNLDLKPAFKFYTNIIQIKKVKKGEVIGYNASYKTNKDILIAILPVGYSNGVPKTNQYVIINNKKYNLIGEVCMNMCFVLIDEEVKTTDKVTLIGDGITVGTFSRINNKIIHEVIIEVGCLNKHRYISKNKIEFEE